VCFLETVSSNALEAQVFLRKEQGGFREAEECVGQVMALYEALRRRQIVGVFFGPALFQGGKENLYLHLQPIYLPRDKLRC
jgi:hypothetical protein